MVSTFSKPLQALVLGAAITAMAVSAASARGVGRGSSDGDSLERQEQQNPAFIEPYQFANPATYRLGHPRAGYDERQWVEYHRGSVFVQPYYGR